MAIAHQSAMPQVAPRRRPRHRPMVLVPRRRRGRALAQVSGLVMVTALGAALLAGAVGIVLLMLAAGISGN
jgi:hypothetical protein